MNDVYVGEMRVIGGGGGNGRDVAVSPQVLAKVRGKQEDLSAAAAAVRFAGGVDLLVLAQSRLVEEAFAAAVADVRPRLGVGLLLLRGGGSGGGGAREAASRRGAFRLAGLADAGAQRHHFGDGRRVRVDRVQTFVGLNFVPAAERGVAASAGELR